MQNLQSKSRLFGLICLVTIAGCTPRAREVAEPPSITLKAALVDVIDALNAARAQSDKYDERIGLNPCTVNVTFNVAAKTDETSGAKLGLTVGPPVIPVGINANGDYSITSEGSRGNQVAVQMVSPACLPDKTLGATAPEKIALAQEQITKARGEGPPYLVQRKRVFDPFWSGRTRGRPGTEPGNAEGDRRNGR